MAASVFKSPESRERFRAVYNGILSSFPFEQQYVDTSFGPTFLLHAGTPDKPPAVVLHGSCSNSVFMTPELMALSQTHSVYAADIIGEAGNSDDRRPDIQGEAYTLWLREVFDKLGLKSAVLIGSSLGGWLALQFAAAFPERVSSLILIAPGGLAGQNEQTLEKAVAMIRDPSAGEAPTVDETITGGAAIPKEVLDFMNLILQVYTPITEVLPLMTDAQLSRLIMPVQLIGGDSDTLLDMPGAARQLKESVPQAKIVLLENTGHMIPNAAPYYLPFLNRSGV